MFIKWLEFYLVSSLITAWRDAAIADWIFLADLLAREPAIRPSFTSLLN
jgi:hypothetical protein